MTQRPNKPTKGKLPRQRRELESSFKVHFNEMDNCEKNKCYWALLHLVVILPDICAALETNNGETDGDKYQKWCEKNLSNPKLAKQDWWAIRCGLLHQG